MPGPANSQYANNVYSSPLAVVKIGGYVIGKMNNFTATENLTYLPVREVGNVFPVEFALISSDCSFTASLFVVELSGLGDNPNPLWPLQARNAAELANTILLGDVMVNIELYSRFSVNGRKRLIEGPLKSEGDDIRWYPMGTIKDAVLNSRSFTLGTDQITVQNISGLYPEPMMVYSQ